FFTITRKIAFRISALQFFCSSIRVAHADQRRASRENYFGQTAELAVRRTRCSRRNARGLSRLHTYSNQPGVLPRHSRRCSSRCSRLLPLRETRASSHREARRHQTQKHKTRNYRDRKHVAAPYQLPSKAWQTVGRCRVRHVSQILSLHCAD